MLQSWASGESQQSLSFAYRLVKSTVINITKEACDATYITTLSSQKNWLRIANGFEELWNLSNVIAALDGKHIGIQCTAGTGIKFHNYKGNFNLVLLPVCNARYCFTLTDIGQYGSTNENDVLKNSEHGKELIYPH